jgi:hypothetical protein
VRSRSLRLGLVHNPGNETHVLIEPVLLDAPGRCPFSMPISAPASRVADPRFAAEVERLVVAAREDRAAEVFVAAAFDQARQVNVRGDNSGTINLTS